jgi:Cd2+/Zn2+-exporting ATPase
MKGKNNTHSNTSEKIKNLRNIALKIYFNEALIFILLLSLLYHGIGFFNLTFSYFDKNVSDLLLVVFSIVGVVPVVVSAVKALFKKNITVDLLASVALIFTIIQHEWVSAVFINLMLASARLFSAFTERKTENIISHLLKLRPLKVKIKKGDYTEEVGINDIKVGDIVVVESGERVSVDGVVIEGSASIDQSTLTGESEPVSKTVGSKVFSSTLCLSGSLFVKAEKVGEDTTLSKMIALVDEASREKTKTETVANRFSAWYISGTIICAVLVYIFTHNLNLVLSILLVTDVLWKKTARALEESRAHTLVLGGGVSANTHIRRTFTENVEKNFPEVAFNIPGAKLTTDNALMIAIAGYFRASIKDYRDPLTLVAESNLTLA